MPAVALPAVAVPTVAAPTIAAPFQPRELVTERTKTLLVALATWLANRFTNLALEPGVEPTVDLPLCIRISLGGHTLPTFADPYDLLQVLALIEVVLACDARGIAWVIKRPSLVVDRSWRIEARANRPNLARTVVVRNDDFLPATVVAVVVRTGLGHRCEREGEQPKVK